jgi:hypothetical protein
MRFKAEPKTLPRQMFVRKERMSYRHRPDSARIQRVKNVMQFASDLQNNLKNVHNIILENNGK